MTGTSNDELLSRAREAAENAYAPYSSFPVGAAALTRDGTVFTGSNVENSSFGLTICAERSAVSAAVSAGHREVVAIAVSAPRKPGTSPCGACRQVLNEFRPCDEDMVVILDDGGSGMPIRLERLLPRAFGPRSLEQPMVVILDDSGSGMPPPLEDLLPLAFGPRSLDQSEDEASSDSPKE